MPATRSKKTSKTSRATDSENAPEASKSKAATAPAKKDADPGDVLELLLARTSDRALRNALQGARNALNTSELQALVKMCGKRRRHPRGQDPLGSERCGYLSRHHVRKLARSYLSELVKRNQTYQHRGAQRLKYLPVCPHPSDSVAYLLAKRER